MTILNRVLFAVLLIILCVIFLYYNYHTLFCLYWTGSFSKPHVNTCKNPSGDCLKSDRKIPRIIHQIWIGPKEPPMHWIKTVQNFARNNGYSYKLWRDVDIDALGLTNLRAYRAEPSWAGKADIARYEILYRYGGIYVDADSMIINEDKVNLDKVFSDIVTDSFAAYEKNGSCLIANGIIGSVAGGQFMSKMIKYIKETYEGYRIFGIPAFISTGPYAMSHLYYRDNNWRLMTVLPSDYFYPAHWWGVDQKQSQSDIELKYPNAYMYQFGYTTNS